MRSQMMGESFVVGVAKLAGLHLLVRRRDAEGDGEFGVAFEDEERALFDAGPPSGGRDGGAGGKDDDVGDTAISGGHADRVKDGGPGTGIITGDVEVERWFRGAEGDGEEEETASA